jgi:cytochrome P450
VPPRDFERFRAWSTDLSLAFSARIAEERARIERALAGLLDWADRLIAERRRTPGPDLISALIAAEESGDRLDAAELRALITVLIFGGQDTTQCQLACALATFVRHPDQWALLARHPELAAGAAEEVLRYEPAGAGSPRVATRDFQLHELAVEAGTIALPSGPAANRDPAAYPDPERFDITRRHGVPQLTFGGGEHYCLGAALARAELQEALPILARRLPHIAPAAEIEWRRQALIRGPERLRLLL